MLIKLLTVLSLLAAAASALASSSSDPPLCLHGCCGQALSFPSRELLLSSGTILRLPEPKIPCCECPADDSPPRDQEIAANNSSHTPIIDATPELITSRQPPPFSIITCPEACPCCKWCEPLPQCQGLRRSAAKYSAVRNMVGCDSLPEDTPICPAGKCSNNCLCGETLVVQVADYLLDKRRPARDDGPPELIHEEAPLLASGFIPKPPGLSPPWLVPGIFKPLCQPMSPCGPRCKPIKPECGEYREALIHLPPFQKLRTAVGCDIYPATTPLCPIGQCQDNCICREVLVKELDAVLLGGPHLVNDEIESRSGEHGEL